ncbi:MAG: DUF4124 domain-containing protein [Nitrospinae bacterium]|nr:DUF4124 domain-containing protein [Nitrospinota bacterium]
MKQKVIAAGLAAALSFPTPALAQGIYKWVDEKGQAHYGDSQYSAPPKVKEKKEVVAPEKYVRPPLEEEAPVNEAPANGSAQNGEGVANGENGQAEEKAPEKDKGVEMVGELEIENTMTGLALLRATLKNNFKYPVDGLRLDLILFHVEARRAADLAIEFDGGKKKPDRLEAGETAVVEYEINLHPEEIAGYNYRIVWAYNERVPAPGEDETPEEGIYHKVVPRPRKQAGAPGQAIAPGTAPAQPVKAEEEKVERKRGSRREIQAEKKKMEEAAKKAAESQPAQ